MKHVTSIGLRIRLVFNSKFFNYFTRATTTNWNWQQ